MFSHATRFAAIQPTILVIAHSRALRRALAASLARCRYRVIAVDNLVACRRLLEFGTPQLVLVHPHAPELTVARTAELLRPAGSVPLIVLCDFSASLASLALYEDIATDLLGTPINDAELASRVRWALQRRQSQNLAI